MRGDCRLSPRGLHGAGASAALAACWSHLPSFLTLSPNTRYTCVPFTIIKLTSPTSTAKSKNRWPQATAHHFTEVAPLQSPIRAPYQQTFCCCVACTQRSHPSAPLALVCFVVVFLVQNLYFPPAQVICWNCALRKSGPRG
jgi:hypothetical protein